MLGLFGGIRFVGNDLHHETQWPFVGDYPYNIKMTTPQMPSTKGPTPRKQKNKKEKKKNQRHLANSFSNDEQPWIREIDMNKGRTRGMCTLKEKGSLQIDHKNKHMDTKRTNRKDSLCSTTFLGNEGLSPDKETGTHKEGFIHSHAVRQKRLNRYRIIKRSMIEKQEKDSKHQNTGSLLGGRRDSTVLETA